MDILNKKFINWIFKYETYGENDGFIYIQNVRLLCDINLPYLKKGARVKTIIFSTKKERVLFYGIPNSGGDIGKIYMSLYDIPWENRCTDRSFLNNSTDIYSPLSMSWDDLKSPTFSLSETSFEK